MSPRVPPPSPPFSGAIRAAEERDAARIAEIYNEAVRTTVATFDTETRSLTAQREWMRAHAPRFPMLVAIDSGTLVGWAALSPWSERRAYDGTAEDSVYVADEARGKGAGRALLSSLLERAGPLGFHTVLARVAAGNPVSLGLHTRFGFREVGVMREVGYKFDRWVDVHLLQLILPARPAGSTVPSG